MNPSLLLVLSAIFLLVPWACAPVGGRKPEIHGFLSALWWVDAFYCKFWHGLEVRRTAPLPDRGGAILISNHTCGLDPCLLQAGCRRVLGFLILRDWYDFWAFRPICRLIRCIPVDRNGRDLASTRAALRALKDGRVVTIFPEGKITPESGRVLGEARPGAAFLVLHSRAPVVPAYLWGTPPTELIVKALVTPSKSGVTFGLPIDFSDLDPDEPVTKERLAAVTARLMDAIRTLKEQAEERGDAPRPEAGSISERGRDDRRLDDPPRTLSGERAALLRS